MKTKRKTALKNKVWKKIFINKFNDTFEYRKKDNSD